MKNKHKCCCCGKVATWHDEYGNHRARYYCDDCIPRGSISNVENIEDFGEPTSSDNIMWWEKECVTKDLLKNGTKERNNNSFYYEILDGLGRRRPHSDYICCVDGFNIEDNSQTTYITWENITSCIDNNCIFMKYKDIFLIKDAMGDIFLKYRDQFDRTKIKYNLFMSKFGIYMKTKNNDFPNIAINQKEIKKFYINFKSQLHPPKGGCLSKGRYPLARHVDKCSY